MGRREADRLDREADEELNLRVPPAIGTGGELCLIKGYACPPPAGGREAKVPFG